MPTSILLPKSTPTPTPTFAPIDDSNKYAVSNAEEFITALNDPSIFNILVTESFTVDDPDDYLIIPHEKSIWIDQNKTVNFDCDVELNGRLFCRRNCVKVNEFINADPGSFLDSGDFTVSIEEKSTTPDVPEPLASGVKIYFSATGGIIISQGYNADTFVTIPEPGRIENCFTVSYLYQAATIYVNGEVYYEEPALTADLPVIDNQVYVSNEFELDSACTKYSNKSGYEIVISENISVGENKLASFKNNNLIIPDNKVITVNKHGMSIYNSTIISSSYGINMDEGTLYFSSSTWQRGDICYHFTFSEDADFSNGVSSSTITNNVIYLPKYNILEVTGPEDSIAASGITVTSSGGKYFVNGKPGEMN